MTTGKTIALTRQTFVDKVMSLLFNMHTFLLTEIGSYVAPINLSGPHRASLPSEHVAAAERNSKFSPRAQWLVDVVTFLSSGTGIARFPYRFGSRVVRRMGSGEAGNSGWAEGDQQHPLKSSYASPGSLIPRHSGTDMDGVILLFVLRELHIFSGIY